VSCGNQLGQKADNEWRFAHLKLEFKRKPNNFPFICSNMVFYLSDMWSVGIKS